MKRRYIKKHPPFSDTVTGYDFLNTDKPLTPRKAMRQKCLECCCGSSPVVKKCDLVDCTLWPYRLGVGLCTNLEGEIENRPRRRRSDAQIAATVALGERAKASRRVKG